MILTLQQAASETGKAKSTIQRAIKSGKLSASRNEDGSYSIDSSELVRVYELRATSSKPVAMKQYATHERNDETELLRAKVELLQMQNEILKETTQDLRKRLDNSDAERRQLLMVLQDQSKDNSKSWLNIFKK